MDFRSLIDLETNSSSFQDIGNLQHHNATPYLMQCTHIISSYSPPIRTPKISVNPFSLYPPNHIPLPLCPIILPSLTTPTLTPSSPVIQPGISLPSTTPSSTSLLMPAKTCVPANETRISGLHVSSSSSSPTSPVDIGSISLDEADGKGSWMRIDRCLSHLLPSQKSRTALLRVISSVSGQSKHHPVSVSCFRLHALVLL